MRKNNIDITITTACENSVESSNNASLNFDYLILGQKKYASQRPRSDNISKAHYSQLSSPEVGEQDIMTEATNFISAYTRPASSSTNRQNIGLGTAFTASSSSASTGGRHHTRYTHPEFPDGEKQPAAIAKAKWVLDRVLRDLVSKVGIL